ncbi:MAG: hypothetical protein WB696_19835, partial [Chthoniobacterales bacterium]
ALLVGYRSIQICALVSASPARTGLPAAHFERNDVTIICETVHWVYLCNAFATRRNDGLAESLLIPTAEHDAFTKSNRILGE